MFGFNTTGFLHVLSLLGMSTGSCSQLGADVHYNT